MAKNYQVVFQATIDPQSLQNELNKLGKQKLNLNAKGLTDFGNAAKSSGGMLGEFAHQLGNLSSTIPKVAAFGLATTAIGAFTDAVRSGIDAVFEMDAALTEFKKVSDISGEALEEYTDRATELGLTVARTGAEMVSAATTFKKSGFSEEDSLMLSEISSRYQNIADTQVDAADAASFIISQMKAFNITAQDSVSIIDKVNEVANNLSLGTNDLSQAMEVAGAALVTYGNDINDMISLVTAGTEIMVGRSTQVARGLNTIAGRITKNEDALKSYGVEIYNVDGSLRSTYDILAELAPKWQTMSDAERVALGETLAGTNQYKVLASVLGNFDSALKAHTIAEEAAGSSIRENQRYMESLEAHLNNLKSAWQALANDVISSDFIKALLDAGTAVLKFADSDIGQLIIKTTAFIGVFKLSKNIMLPALTKIGQSFVDLIGKITFAIMQGEELSTVLGFLGSAISALAIPAAVAGFVAFAYHLSKTHDEAYKTEQRIADLNDRIVETNNTISRLKEAGADDSVLEAYRQQAEDLDNQLKEAQKTLFHLKNEAISMPTMDNGDVGAGLGGYKIQTTATEATTTRVQKAINAYTKAQETVEDYEEAVLKGKASETDYIDALTEQASARQDLIDIYAEFKEYEDDLSKSEIEEYNQLQNLLERLGYLKYEYQYLSKVGLDANNAVDLLSNGLSEQSLEVLDNFGAIQHLVNAEEALRNGQKLSGETIDWLIKKYPQLSSYQTAMANGELAAADAIHAVGVQSFNTSKTVIANSKAEAEAVVKTAKETIASCEAEITALNAKMAAHQMTTADYGRNYGYQATTLHNARQQLAVAQSALDAYDSAMYYGTEVIADNTSTTDKNTDAQRELEEQIRDTTDAIKKQSESIKDASDYMVDKIDEQIDKLKSNKDAVNEYYDDWINRLKDTNEELEDQIELENALQKLAEAKSKQVRVYKDGGFAYVSDTQAVAKAQREASTLQRQKEQKDLIAALEEARKKDLSSIDKQIEAWEAEKKTWQDATDAYDDYLATQALGIDQEGKNWSKRLGQAKSYASEYLKLMQAIDDVESGKKTPAQGQKVIKTVSSDIKGLPSSTSSLRSQVNTSSPIASYTPVNGVIKTSTSGSTTINVANITLPNVSNPTEFIADLQDFARYASQSANVR